MNDSRIHEFLENKLVKSFIAYSIFRAFYGFGILIVTYFIDKNTIIPWWLFLLFSMIFSRILFKQIKKRKQENIDSN
ncbi:MAG: hypothetical protein VW970_05525 [Candidatus Poseidoniales archaeon]|jgi:hypothetical protein|nr:hypothetical protein [Candidatus Thalassarchaeaceae archaeon]|tara:strand:- start:59 stop:289 length:231 start_codon:yes stop_codon:yes gene_type:complete